MNPNRLNGMIRKQRKNTKNLENENRKKIARHNRSERRVATFAELDSRNFRVQERAEKLALAVDKPYDGYTRSPWFVLRKGDEKDGWVFGKVSTRRVEDERSTGFGRKFDFRIAATNATTAKKLLEDPYAILDGLSEIKDEIRKSANFRLYDVIEGSEGSEIWQLAYGVTSYRKFSPITAINRALERTRIDETLTELEITASVFESAIIDPNLNPHLQDIISQNSQSNQTSLVPYTA